MGNLCSAGIPECNFRAKYDLAYCFVNAKSGGGVGKKLLNLGLRRVEWSERYGAVRIVDLLSKEDRETSLKELSELERKKEKVCAVCAGGDGTVKWVLQMFASAKIRNVPLGIIPFGTGNDLSRSLGWGGSAPWGLVNTGLTRFRDICDEFRRSMPVKADMWRVLVKLRQGGTVTTVGSDCSTRVDKEKTDSRIIDENMINYFSIGIDAKIAYDFARNRKSTQMLNQMEYGIQGAKKTFFPTPRLGVTCNAKVNADGKIIKNLDPNAVAYIFHNIRSYGAGMDIWKDAYNRRHFPRQFGPQRMGDGLLELLTVQTAPQIPLGHMSKEAQAKSYELDLSKAEAVYMQFDGEPFYVEKPESVRVERASTVKLLRRRKKGRSEKEDDDDDDGNDENIVEKGNVKIDVEEEKKDDGD